MKSKNHTCVCSAGTEAAALGALSVILGVVLFWYVTFGPGNSPKVFRINGVTTASLFYIILAYKRFRRNARCSDSGETCVRSEPLKISCFSALFCQMSFPNFKIVRMLSLFLEVCLEVPIRSFAHFKTGSFSFYRLSSVCNPCTKCLSDTCTVNIFSHAGPSLLVFFWWAEI